MYPMSKQESYEDKTGLDIMYEGILSDLRRINDIHGAMLIQGKNSILACDVPEYMNVEEYLHGIMTILEEKGLFTLNKKAQKLFGQHIFDYNGCKVLAKKVKDLTLLVMLKKSGYVGLAMLDIENSVREINQMLQSTRIENNGSSLLNLTSVSQVLYPVKRKSPITSFGEKDEYR